MFTLTFEDAVPGLTVALVEAEGICVAPAPDELRELCERVAAEAGETGLNGGDERRKAIRNLLRNGGFKPSGRNKPAQEYLLRTVVQEGALPAISNAVDVINAVSLQAGLPISLVSLDRVGTELSLRYGRPDEEYVFNRTGQQLDVRGLLCLCACDGDDHCAVGSPVKDSMKAKIGEDDRHLLACIYASETALDREELSRWAGELGEGLRRFCQATTVDISLRP